MEERIKMQKYKESNLEILNRANLILKSNNAFHNSTMRVQMSFLIGLEDVDYTTLDCKLKAIRQDFYKILVIMNSINKTYSAYQDNTYTNSYFTMMNDQATSELGCFIEYLFAKYRVILEYIQQILEICIPPRLSENELNEYKMLKKYYTKYDYLLKYVAKNVSEDSNLINMEWFQQLRVERDLIIHDGATCLVFGDRDNLLFKVMTTDAMDKEDEMQSDDFITTNNGLVIYDRYWSLHISKLIIFFEIIFEFLLHESEISDEAKYIFEMHFSQWKNGLIDSNGNVLTDPQDVLENMLTKVANDLENYRIVF